MVIILLIIIIFLLAPGLLSVLGTTAVGITAFVGAATGIAGLALLIAYPFFLIKELRKLSPYERNRELKKIGTICLIAVLIIAGIVVAMKAIDANHQFEMGMICIGSSPDEANTYFQQLPTSYTDRIIDAYLEAAEDTSEYSTMYSSVAAQLSYAAEYASNDYQKLDQIRKLQCHYAITMNQGTASRELILAHYQQGYITGTEAVQYAAEMYDYVPSKSYWSEENKMRDDAIALVEALAASVPLAKERYEDWSQLPREYQQAINMVHARDYKSAETWFAAHSDYKHSLEYLSLCMGVNELCGTWKDNDGNILVVSVDMSKKLEMLNGNAELATIPHKIYLTATYNGKSITYFYDDIWNKSGWNHQCYVAEDSSANTPRYKFSYGGYFSPYSILVNSSNSISVTYTTARRTSSSSVSKTKQWTNTFTRIK